MALIDARCQVSKETYELMLGLAGFVGVVKQAIADGWRPKWWKEPK